VNRLQKLLVAAHSGCQGGAELCLDTTLRHLDRARFAATVLFGCEGSMVERARAMGYPAQVLPLAWWMAYEPSLWHYKNALAASLPRIRRLAGRMRREGIGLVYTNTAVIFEAALAARLARVPHVWHVHEILSPQHMRPRMLPLRWIARLIGRLSDRVVFESNAAREVCRGLIDESKMRTVYNSVRWGGEEVESGEWGVESLAADGTPAGDTENRRALRAQFGLDDDHCAVAWIGRFSERKHPLILIRAAGRMGQASPCRFLFVGEGPLEGLMRETINGLGLGDRCRLVPFQEDVRPVLQAADVLALTSREESFGLVLVEAAAQKRPAVATRTQGPAEIVVDGLTGLLVEPDDEAGLAAAIDRLAADPPLRLRLGQAAARRACELYSPERNTRQIEAVFEEVLGKS
jgi:glycosyltransferase involved in cell wall biosynthesis